MTLGIWGIFGMLIFICAGGAGQIHSLRRELISINRNIEMPQELLSSLPRNQLSLTTKQVLAVIENVHQITARTHVLLDRIEPSAFLGDLKFVVERTSNLLERNVTDRLLTMVDQINLLPIRKLSESLSRLDFAKLSELAESTKLIEEKLAKLHEIKIQI